MIILNKYNAGTYTKDNPYFWTGSYEEFLQVPFHRYLTAALKDPNSFYTKDYIKYVCKDCGKEFSIQIASIYHFHEKTIKGEKDLIQDDLICNSCELTLS